MLNDTERVTARQEILELGEGRPHLRPHVHLQAGGDALAGLLRVAVQRDDAPRRVEAQSE